MNLSEPPLRFRPLEPVDHPCHYLSGLSARTEHFLADGVPESSLESILARGYRHFGHYYFSPGCPGCVRCIPIRVCLEGFSPGRSQRRVLRSHRDFEVELDAAGPSDESFALYLSHKRRFGHTDSEPYDAYVRSFYPDSPHRRTLSVRQSGRLVSRLHLDWTARATSMVYCYYDDTLPGRSPGTFSIVTALVMARDLGKRYCYLGFYLSENRSMSYKIRYYPSEILTPRGWIVARTRDGEVVAPRELERTRFSPAQD